MRALATAAIVVAQRVRWRVLVLALALLAIMVTVAPEQAAAQTDTTFISNTGQVVNSRNLAVSGPSKLAQQFTTGPHSHGYSVTEVVLNVKLNSTLGTALNAIYSSNSSNRPGEKIVDLIGSVASVGNQSFTPANTTILASSTEYFVVLGVPSGHSPFVIASTDSDNEDAGASPGWSIANSGLFGNGFASNLGYALEIGIKGVAATAPSPPTVANAIPDRAATVGTNFSYQFPANTFADTNIGDLLTYTATKADGAALPSWLSFSTSTRTFTGTPAAGDVGTFTVKVTVSDGNGGSVSDEFDIVVWVPQQATESVFDKGRFLLGNLHKGGVTRPIGTVRAFANSFKTPQDDDFVQRLRSLHLAGGYGSGNRVSIHADSSGDPGTEVLTLRYAGRGSSVDGVAVHEFRTGWDGLKLAHNTTYWVVVGTPGIIGTNYPTKSFTTSDSESSAGLSGVRLGKKLWAIGNTHRNSIEVGVWTDSDYPQAMRMELRGDSEPYFPVSKPAAPGRLVGNREHLLGDSVPSIASGVSSITGIAQSFTTGGAGKLRSVRLDGGFSSASQVSIYSDFEGAPGSKLRELLNPSALSVTTTVHEFHAGKFGLALRASTIYWVVLEGTGSLETTMDTGESGLTGWSIGDGARARQNVVWEVIRPEHTDTVSMEILGFSSDPAPRVKGHASIGSQGTDCVWRPGETVDLTLRFNEAVTVDTTNGTPSLAVDLSFRAARRASYASGSGTRSLLFSYAITPADGQNSSMRVRRNGLRLNGGTIRNQSGTANADLRHSWGQRGIPASVPRGCQPEAGEAEWLVGNSTKGRGASDWTSGLRALSFTTGGSTATLKQALVFGSNWDSSSRVSVYSDSSGQPYLRLRTTFTGATAFTSPLTTSRWRQTPPTGWWSKAPECSNDCRTAAKTARRGGRSATGCW